MDFEMLGGVAVGYFYDLRSRLTQYDFAIVAPGCPGRIARGDWQGVDQPRHCCHDFFCQLARSGEQPCGRFVPVLGLTDEIGSDDVRVGGVVGDDRDFGA